jgi:hypothetical protein
MKKRVVSVGLVLLLVVIGLSGCQEKTGDSETKKQFDSRFIGEWQNVETSPDNETWTFYINSTVKDVRTQEFEGEPLTSTSWFNCEVNADDLCLSSIDELPDSPSYYSECFGYVFSDDTGRLTLSFNGLTFMIFTKIS